MKRGPWLFVTLDDRHHVALLRGDGAYDVIETLSLKKTWSKGGRGWVVDQRHVADIVAFCEHRRQLVVVSERKAATT